MFDMNIADAIIIGILVVSTLVSIIRGFLREAVSLTSWVVAAWVGIVYSKDFGAMLTFTEMASLRVLIAFIVIFVSIVLAGAVINFFVGKFIRKTPFSSADRALGTAFGFFRGILLVMVLVLLAGLTPIPGDKWWHESYAIPKFMPGAMWLKSVLPQDIAENFEFPDAPVEVDKKSEDKAELKNGSDNAVENQIKPDEKAEEEVQ